MAERRMFHGAVVESDAFLDLPVGAQALYFHLGMQADDDGFVNGPKQIAKNLNLDVGSLDVLEENGFVWNFDGIVVIRHWRMANSWKSDRLQLPRYPEIAEKLFLVDDRFYEKRKIRNAKNLLQVKRDLVRHYGIRSDSKKKREEKKREEKKREENRINEKKRSENIPPNAAVSGGAAEVGSADGPTMVIDGVVRDESDVLLHRFGKDVVHLTKAQIQGLRRIMDECTLDILVRQLAMQILEREQDPGNHYETIKNWYQERFGDND